MALLTLLSLIGNFAYVDAHAAAHASATRATVSSQHSAPPGSQPVMPGLWDAQNYEIQHHAASCPQPPRSLAARLALSDVELSLFGLPTHKDIPNQVVWRQQITAATTRTCDYAVDTIQGKPVINSYFTSHTWGGWLTEGSGSYGWIDNATAYFNVPCTDGSYATQASEWVGVGGAFNSHPLVQTGVEELVSYGNVSYKPFYEYVPQGSGGNGANVPQNMPLHCSDHMYMYAKTNGYTYIADNSTGTYSAQYDGSASNDSAEWIVERLSVASGCPGTLGCQPLSNYHYISWSSCWFGDTSGYSHNPTDFPDDEYLLENNSGQQLEWENSWQYNGPTSSFTSTFVQGS